MEEQEKKAYDIPYHKLIAIGYAPRIGIRNKRIGKTQTDYFEIITQYKGVKGTGEDAIELKLFAENYGLEYSEDYREFDGTMQELIILTQRV